MPKRLNQAAAATAQILIVDSYPIVREGLAMLIGRHSDLAVCGSTGDGDEALRIMASAKPDLAVIDGALKTGGGAIELVKRIKARHAEVHMLVWSMYNEPHYAERALRAGATGYITKEQTTDKVLEAIRRALDGKIALSDPLADDLLNRVVGRGGELPSWSPMEVLSDRELEVFHFLGQGLDRNEIATRLRISAKTVETYRARIKDKLSLGSAAAVLRSAVQWWGERC